MPRKRGEKAPGARSLRARPTKWLYLVHRVCKKTEDSSATTESARFRTSVRLELRDNDTGIFDGDDRLGEVVVAPDNNHPYDQERSGTFSDDGAQYVLNRVVSEEGP